MDKPAVRANVYLTSSPASDHTNLVSTLLKQNGIQPKDVRPTSTTSWVYFGQVTLSGSEDEEKLKQLDGTVIGGRELRTKILPPLEENQLDALDECILFVTNINSKTSTDEFKALFPSARNVSIPETGGKKQGLAYLEFGSKAEVDVYMERLQGADLDGRKLRLQYYESVKTKDQSTKIVHYSDESIKPSKSMAVDKSDDKEKRSKVLFVGNLSFSTSEETVMSYFPLCTDVRILRFADSGQSKGHGFIEFMNEEDATVSLKSMRYAVIDGRKLSLELASNKPAEKSERPKSKILFMGNLAYNTTEAVIKQYFPAATSVRLLTLADGQSKGVGFIDFSNMQDAEKALRSMKDVMINGKELLLDYARDKSIAPPMEFRSKCKTLFVGNLKFSTSEKTLRSYFPNCTDLRILVSGDTGKSKGVGFIDFRTVAEAESALHEMQNIIIDDRQVILNFSDNNNQDGPNNPPFRVLFIANLSNTTTESMIRKKFSRCQDVRILNNANKSKRVGFVDFMNVRDAEMSLKKSKNLSIDGNRIIVSYAKDRGDKNQFKDTDYGMEDQWMQGGPGMMRGPMQGGPGMMGGYGGGPPFQGGPMDGSFMPPNMRGMGNMPSPMGMGGNNRKRSLLGETPRDMRGPRGPGMMQGPGMNPGQGMGQNQMQGPGIMGVHGNVLGNMAGDLGDENKYETLSRMANMLGLGHVLSGSNIDAEGMNMGGGGGMYSGGEGMNMGGGGGMNMGGGGGMNMGGGGMNMGGGGMNMGGGGNWGMGGAQEYGGMGEEGEPFGNYQGGYKRRKGQDQY